jgi:hypothetical protein
MAAVRTCSLSTLDVQLQHEPTFGRPLDADVRHPVRVHNGILNVVQGITSANCCGDFDRIVATVSGSCRISINDGWKTELVNNTSVPTTASHTLEASIPVFRQPYLKIGRIVLTRTVTGHLYTTVGDVIR